MKELEFYQTEKIKEFGNFTIVMQTYNEFDDETEEEQEIYNVSIEYKVDESYSETLDIYESYNKQETSRYFENLVWSIEQTSGIKE